MPKKIPKPNRKNWLDDLAEYRAAVAELNGLDNNAHRDDPAKFDAAFDRCEVAEDKVLAQRAPDIDAVADKLMILWDEDVWSENEESTQMQIIIGDLRWLARSSK